MASQPRHEERLVAATPPTARAKTPSGRRAVLTGEGEVRPTALHPAVPRLALTRFTQSGNLETVVVNRRGDRCVDL
jgi:hypothetical protein